MTNKKLAEEIRNDLISHKPGFDKVQYMLEPASRNTAPAIGLAAAKLRDLDPDAVMIVLPSDHVIKDGENFLSTIKSAHRFASDGYLATIGLNPARADTAFGYIRAGSKISSGEASAYNVDKFTEKPDQETAKLYLSEGGYYWNSGMFVFRADTILEEIKRMLPGLYDELMAVVSLQKDVAEEEAASVFSSAPAISIDYGILEKTDKAVVIPTSLDWSDVGSLTAIEQLFPKDEKGNVIVGNVVDIDSQNSIVYGEKRLIATLGLKDAVVIDTHDATLVSSKERSQDVRKVVDILKQVHAEEYLTHRTSARPWGTYTVLDKGPGYKIKLVEIRQGEKLSHQLHHHRSEHWIVLSGTAKVTRGDETYNVHTNESTFIPASTPHRLENLGKIPLKIIEVQNGEYLEEDDIVRIEDIYDRD